jgi:hypothetical protein
MLQRQFAPAEAGVVSALSRAATLTFDDGAEWAWPASAASEGERSAAQHALAGSFVAAVPLVRGVIVGGADPGAASAVGVARSCLLILRVGSLPPHNVAAAVVAIGPDSSVVRSAYYGPPPGSLAVAIAAAAAAGTGYVVKPSVPSASKRAFVLLCHGMPNGGSTSAHANGPRPLWLVTLPYRQLDYTPVGDAVTAAAGIATLVGNEDCWQHLPAAGARQRDLKLPAPAPRQAAAIAAPPQLADDGVVEWARLVHACDLDVAGPRGVGTVLVGARRLLVLDLEEDEEAEEEDAAEDGDAESGEGGPEADGTNGAVDASGDVAMAE